MNPEELQKKIDNLELGLQQANQSLKQIKLHTHNGYDSSWIEYDDLAHKRLYTYHTIYGADAATAANYGVFWIVPIACTIIGFSEVHKTAGSDGGTVTVQLEKLTGTEALDAGAEVLSTALSLKATADTVQDGVMTTTLANRSLAKDDRLALKDAGVLTSVANVTVKIELQVV